MSRNGNRITNYYNLIQTRADWEYIAAKAKAAGASALVALYYPGANAGVRKIDKAIEIIRAAMGWPYVFEMRKAEKVQE